MITLPSIEELYTGYLADLQAQYGSTIPAFGKNFLRVVAAVQAGKHWLMYKLIGKVQKNLTPDTADSEASGGTLERFGTVWLGRLPFSASAGQYGVTVTGTAGTVIPVPTTFKSDDSSTSPGFLFVVDTAYTVGDVSPLNIRALTPGAQARLSAGDTLTITGPVIGLDDQVTVTVENVVPTDVESTELYRQRVLEKIRTETQGGSAGNYRLWANEVSGVKQTYVFTATGTASEVNLFVEATTAASSDGKGTPPEGILQAVQDSVQDATAERPGRKPATDKVNYLPITVREVEIETVGSPGATGSQTSGAFNAVTAELAKFRPFVASVDLKSARNDVYDKSRAIATLRSANPDIPFDTIILTVDGTEVESYEFTDGNIPYLNEVNYS